MILPTWIEKFKEPKTEIKSIKGIFYKYSVTYRYNLDKKRTDKITGYLLGKITEAEGFIPSQKNLLRATPAQILQVDIKMFGTYHLFTTLLGKETVDNLLKLFKPDIAEALLTIALMRFSHQCPLKRMPYYHAHDFCSQDWVKNGLDDKKISAVLKFVGENRTILVDWMKSRLNNMDLNLTNFIMIDSTHIPTLSENLHINALGYNPNHSFDEQIRLMYIFSAQLKQPVYYRLINGNISDIKSMKKCVEELQAKNVVFIADKGFYSKENTEMMDQNELEYLIPIKRNNAMIDFSVLSQSNFKEKIKTYFIYQNRIIWYYFYQKEGQEIITFIDEKLRVEEETDYLLRTQTHPEEYTESKFYKKIAHFGTLTLVYKLTNKTTAEGIYQAYKQRNEVETMFDAYKNFLKADKTYMQNRYVMEGWLMANFVAMLAYYNLYSSLKEAKLLSKYSPKDIVEISKSISKLKINNQWQISEITKKHVEIFKKIKIDYLI